MPLYEPLMRGLWESRPPFVRRAHNTCDGDPCEACERGGKMWKQTEAVQRARAIHAEFWGNDHQQRVEDQVLEECGELITAIMHKRRNRPNAHARLQEEMADLLICLELFLPILFKDEANLNWRVDMVAERITKKLVNANSKEEGLEKL